MIIDKERLRQIIEAAQVRGWLIRAVTINGLKAIHEADRAAAG